MNVETHAITCGGCNVTFWMTKELYERRYGDHKSWYCPNGCRMYFPAESEVERLEDDLKVSREERICALRRAVAAENSLRATKGVVTKLRKAAGGSDAL